MDSGVETGSVIGGQFDSMLAKLIVTGATRTEALERARRALDEFHVEGLATVIPFDRVVVRDPAFVGDENGFTVHTRWIETEFENTIEPFTGGGALDEEADAQPRQKVVVEVGGRRLEVSLPGDLALGGGGAGGAAGAVRKKPKARKRGAQGGAAASGDAVTAPMQGTVVKVAVEEGQEVAAGDLVVVLEAMKMENPVTAHKDGVITGLAAGPALPSPRARCSARSSSPTSSRSRSTPARGIYGCHGPTIASMTVRHWPSSGSPTRTTSPTRRPAGPMAPGICGRSASRPPGSCWPR